MIERTIIQLALAASFGVVLSTTAQAQVVRFVASYGNDANLCTRAQPCRTLQRGHNVTPAGGELQILDSGEYGPGVAITKSITISAVGVSATIGSSSNSAITIAAGTVVVLRGLHLRGLSQSALRGIHVVDTATVYLEDCIVEGFQNKGIQGAPTKESGNDPKQIAVSVIARYNRDRGLEGGNWVVRASSFENNFAGEGAWLGGSTIINSRASGNVTGFALSGSTAFGTTAEKNSTGFHVPFSARAVVERSLASGNGYGARMDGFDQFLYAVITISNSVFTANTVGIEVDNDFLIHNTLSLGNNTLSGNQTNLTGAVEPVSPQ